LGVGRQKHVVAVDEPVRRIRTEKIAVNLIDDRIWICSFNIPRGKPDLFGR
jgi:hypothetical protein